MLRKRILCPYIRNVVDFEFLDMNLFIEYIRHVRFLDLVAYAVIIMVRPHE